MVVESFDWPHVIVRVVTLGLLLALPVVVLLAWYHGHRAQHRFSTAELSMLTVLLLIAGTVMWGFTRVRVPSGSASPVVRHATTERVSAPAATEPAASVAVVPFANLTGDASKEYFSDGLAEELINELTRVPGLKVPARTSSFAYKGRNMDIRQIARELRVATILEGSVRSAGEHIRVTAQLANAETGYHVWSKTYDRSFGDVFKLEDDISAEIVEALKSSMNAQLPAVAAQAPPTGDPEAYRLFLQAKASTIGEVRIRLLDQAVTRDPRFARAWATRASELVTTVAFGAVLPNALAEAENNARQALTLDPNLADAHVALGNLHAWRGEWIAAESSFRRALDLAPNDVSALGAHSIFLLASVGHWHQALDELQRAYAAAPAAPSTIMTLAGAYSLQGMNRDAVAYAERAVELGASNTSFMVTLSRSNAAASSGHYVEAAEDVLPVLPPVMRSGNGGSVITGVYAAIGEPGRRAAASHALTTLVRDLPPAELGILPRQLIVTWYVILDDLDAAFDFSTRSLDEFARSGTVGTSWGLIWSPWMSPFRKDPRFGALVTRLKLFDYWKQYGPPDDCDLHGDMLTCR
jgi:TolB-like protein/Tfp pilus assembly protein PilF